MMNEQNEALNTSRSVILPAKRRRGRPRKEGTLLKKDVGSSQASPVHTIPEPVTQFHTDGITNDGTTMVGKSVFGVIDGCFDAGYFLSVRVGNNGPLLRGVIFEPGRVAPITSMNDIAPQAKLHQRTEVSVPTLSPQDYVGFQPEKATNQPLHLSEKSPIGFNQVLSPVAQPSASFGGRNQPDSNVVPNSCLPSNISNTSLPEKMPIHQNQNFKYGSHFMPSSSVENLRMVEQDDVMQVYEVSVQSEGLTGDTQTAKNTVSQSPSELRPNAVLTTPDGMSNQVNQSQNQDMGSGLHLSPQIHNEFLQGADALHPGAMETQFGFKTSYYSAQSHNAFTENPSLVHRSPLNECGFQTRESFQNDIRDEHLELEDTSVVAQTQDVPLENQQSNAEIQTEQQLSKSEITRPNQELFQGSTNETEPNKLTNNELDLANHVVSQQVDFINTKPNSPKQVEKDQVQHPSQAINTSGATMPLDLEVAAEESTGPGRPENHFLSSSGCDTQREY